MIFIRNLLVILFLPFVSTGFVLHAPQQGYLSNSTIQQLSNSFISPDGLRIQKNEAFKRGEKLIYRMHYGFINAGEVVMEVTNENKLIGGRNTFHVVGIGTTNNSFDLFFKVRDRYESYIDEEAIVPWLFIRRVSEGGYKINQNQVYSQFKNSVESDGQKFDVPENVQDMTSAFYYARTMDFTNAKEGDIFEFPCFVDNETWLLKIKYLGKEIIKADIGKIRCIKFCPVVQKGRIFKKEEDMTAWISDDKNRVPVRAEAKVLVGSIKMDLTDYSGLANPLALVEKK